MLRWVLPEYIQDALPAEAAKPAEPAKSEAKPAAKPAEKKPVEPVKPAAKSQADAKPDGKKPADKKPADAKPVVDPGISPAAARTRHTHIRRRVTFFEFIEEHYYRRPATF